MKNANLSNDSVDYHSYHNQTLRITKDEYYLGIALAVSKRSTCLKRRYGCVIVKNDEIIATGYTGAPRGRCNCIELGYCTKKKKRVQTVLP